MSGGGLMSGACSDQRFGSTAFDRLADFAKRNIGLSHPMLKSLWTLPSAANSDFHKREDQRRRYVAAWEDPNISFYSTVIEDSRELLD